MDIAHRIKIDIKYTQVKRLHRWLGAANDPTSIRYNVITSLENF